MKLLYLLCMIGYCNAIINTYKNTTLQVDELMFRRSGMFSVDNTPAVDAHGESMIKVELEFQRESNEYPGMDTAIQISVFSAEHYDKVGYIKDGKREFCCSGALRTQGVCKEPYKLILDEQYGTRDIYVYDVIFEKNEADGTSKSVVVNQVFPIQKKGLYYLMYSSCNKVTGNVIINGHTRWVNPYGYLPGEYFGFISFYSRMSLAYITASVTWAVLCMRHWRELLMLQNCITAVVALGMIEMALKYFDYHTFNKVGVRSSGLMFFGVIFATIKKVISRLLVLVVSMGYGVVRPSLGDTMYKVTGLGGFYFLLASIQSVVENLSHSNIITGTQYFFMLPVAALDVVFYFWIFLSLQSTAEQLQKRRQAVKLELYKKFKNMLIGSIVVSFVWALYYMYIIVTGEIQQKWENRWILDGFWDVIYCGILFSIMILWRPNKNSQRFAYQQVMSIDHDEEEYGENLEDPVAANFSKPAHPEDEMFGELLDQTPAVAKSD